MNILTGREECEIFQSSRVQCRLADHGWGDVEVLVLKAFLLTVVSVHDTLWAGAQTPKVQTVNEYRKTILTTSHIQLASSFRPDLCEKWASLVPKTGVGRSSSGKRESKTARFAIHSIRVSHIDLDEQSYLEKWGKPTFSGQLPLLFRRNTLFTDPKGFYFTTSLVGIQENVFPSDISIHISQCPLFLGTPTPLSSPKLLVPVTHCILLPDSPSFLFSWHICTKKTKWGHL